MIEPALRDVPDFPGPLLCDQFSALGDHPHWDFIDSAAIEDQPDSEEVRQIAEETALADDRIQRYLAEGRYVVIGISLLQDRKEPQRATALLIIYNYADNTTLEVYLSGRDEISKLRTWCSPTTSPLRRMRRLSEPSSWPGKTAGSPPISLTSSRRRQSSPVRWIPAINITAVAASKWVSALLTSDFRASKRGWT